MRKVNGEDITIRELKNTVFGYDDNYNYTQTVVLIEVNNKMMFAIKKWGDEIIRYPKNPYDLEMSVDSWAREGAMSVWQFILDYLNPLNEYNLENFTFYFAE